MTESKLFQIPPEVTPANFKEAMEQAITLELATIPTYLSTYYSINRTPDQTETYNKILSAILPPDEEARAGKYEKLAQKLTLDVIVYANKTAALIMSVVIEEMLHLALSSNVKQAICAEGPNLMGIAASPGFIFPTKLDGHQPEFPIHLGPLSMQQLATFLMIESPNAFELPEHLMAERTIDYQTIGQFYGMIEDCIRDHYPGPYDLGARLQLTPEPHMAIYTPNSINTVYYDRAHNPHFINQDDSGGLVKVVDGATALHALEEIVEQGEGKPSGSRDLLKLDENGMPVPLPVKDGKVVLKPGDSDDPSGKELSHFDKFYEAYSLGHYYQEMFAKLGLDFFSLLVYDQGQDPKQAYYNSAAANPSFKPGSSNPDDNPAEALRLTSELGNAIFTYILLMVETCYHVKDQKTQFQIFMYGVHKAMIWLLSQFGGDIRNILYHKDGSQYVGSLTFEFYDFAAKPHIRPKAQILDLAEQLSKVWSKKEGWLSNKKYDAYLALPDIALDFDVKNIDEDLGITGNPFAAAEH